MEKKTPERPPALPEPQKPSDWGGKPWSKAEKVEFYFLLGVIFALLILIIVLLSVRQARAAGPCDGGKYEGRPTLVEECLHNREVKARQGNSTGWSGGGAYNCVQWDEWGGVVCYNDFEMCEPGGECFYKGNVEDYCEQYGECTPPWVEEEPYPYP